MKNLEITTVILRQNLDKADVPWIQKLKGWYEIKRRWNHIHLIEGPGSQFNIRPELTLILGRQMVPSAFSKILDLNFCYLCNHTTADLATPLAILLKAPSVSFPNPTQFFLSCFPAYSLVSLSLQVFSVLQSIEVSCLCLLKHNTKPCHFKMHY